MVRYLKYGSKYSFSSTHHMMQFQLDDARILAENRQNRRLKKKTTLHLWLRKDQYRQNPLNMCIYELIF